MLYTNPRGSTGYGEKFLWATWDGWGKLDYQDVMAGVDYAIAHYPVDPKRLGVTGYSYGGFLTNWIITQTTRFKAAVIGAGISNWLSDYGTADIPRTKESEFSGAPWNPEAGERLRALSPITYAANVKTPTLFVHGESDMRVPIEEGEQMYTALKKQHVAGEVHPLSRQLSRRLAAVGHGPPLLPGDGLVAGAPGVSCSLQIQFQTEVLLHPLTKALGV